MTVFTPDDDTERDRATTQTGEESQSTAESNDTMGGVSHTNPETGASFGESQVYTRGRVAMVDGGKAESETTEESEEEESMGEIDHTPREDAPAASEVYERGGEGNIEDVAEDDEE